ncbi:hypothetical protein H2248_002762 [Termitomyces sp. 'cryptogamus']|nr:hypothetical protein H2248_002762 [Termitomyces sp. 'cryptogamus']
MVYNISGRSVLPIHHLSLSFVNHYSCIAILPTMIIALGLRQLSAGLALPSDSSNLNSQLATSYNNRSIYDIVWSCLTVIFACTWMAAHPNIHQGSSYSLETGIGKHSYRLCLLFWALFAPELMVLSSFRQWLVACE